MRKYNRYFILDSFPLYCPKCKTAVNWKYENPNKAIWQDLLCEMCGGRLASGHLKITKMSKKEQRNWNRKCDQITPSVHLNGHIVCKKCKLPLKKAYYEDGCDCGAVVHMHCPKCDDWDCPDHVNKMIYDKKKGLYCPECVAEWKESIENKECIENE